MSQFWCALSGMSIGGVAVLVGASLVTGASPAAAAVDGTITGLVWQDNDSNGVFDSYELPLAGVQVQAFSDEDSSEVATSDADGAYTVSVPTDEAFWRVEASLPDVMSQWRPSVAYQGAEVPGFALDKTVDGQGPIAQDDGSWLVVYGITVTNSGNVDGTYDLDDTLRFDPAFTVVQATVTDAPEGVETEPNWTGTGDTLTVATNVPLAAGAVHQYLVSVRVTVEEAVGELSSPAFICQDTSSVRNSGLTNEATFTYNDLNLVDVVCPPPPRTPPAPPAPPPLSSTDISTPASTNPPLAVTGSDATAMTVLGGGALLLIMLGAGLFVRRRMRFARDQ